MATNVFESGEPEKKPFILIRVFGPELGKLQISHKVFHFPSGGRNPASSGTDLLKCAMLTFTYPGLSANPLQRRANSAVDVSTCKYLVK